MSTLSEWVPLSEYQATRADRFPSDHSLRWQIRRHRRALLQAGALTEIAGKTHILPPLADEVFIEDGRRRVAAAA